MKLGELFVDLGVNSGSAFNTLSNFAFQFNNLATTAEKFAHGFEKVFSPAIKTAPLTHNIQNLAKFLGESEKSIQGIKNAAGEIGVNWESMTGKLKKFSEDRMNFFLNPNSAFFQKQSIFGLTNEDLKGSPLEVMRKIISVISGVGKEDLKAQFASVSGFSQDELTAWSNFFKNRQFYEDNPWNFTSQELEQGNELYMNLNRFNENLGHINDQLGKNLTPTLNKLFRGINKFLESKSFREFVEHPIEGIENLKPNLLKKYDELDWWKKLLLAPVTSLIPFGQAYTTGSLLGEGVTSGVLSLAGNTKNPFLSNLSDLSLKGKIWSGNSNPTIRSSNVARMKQLDELLGAWAEKEGIEILYTSAMGGKHKKGSGHYSGNKIDVQFFKNGKQVDLPASLSEKLREMGYYGGSTGAVGREAQKNGGFHHDLYIGDLESRVAGASRNVTINKETTIYTTPEKVADVADRTINGKDQIAEQLDLRPR